MKLLASKQMRLLAAVVLTWITPAYSLLPLKHSGKGVQTGNLSLQANTSRWGVLRKPVIWIHLHKSAGTLLCKLAQENYERIVSPSVTCNYMDESLNGTRQLGKQAHRMSCEQRKDVFFRNSFTYGQIEREVNEEDLRCKKAFTYGTMVREPLSLIESVVNFNQYKLDRIIPWLMRVSKPSKSVVNCPAPICQHNGHPELGWQMFDNFAVRTLTGFHGWWQPVGGITKDDLQLAKDRLAAMEVVMTLNHLQQHVKQLRKVFGWENIQLRDVRSTAHKVKLGKYTNFLRDLNKHDIALFNYAQELAETRMKNIKLGQ